MNWTKFDTGKIPTWCPGCHNYLLLSAIKRALIELKEKPENIAAVYDVGCAGNMADFIKVYGVHSLHGRAIPVAMGIKYFQPKLNVIVIGGDGGIYGEGLNHLVTAARANIDITVLVANNHLYSLTTGQASPTTPKGAFSKSTPSGTNLEPLNPVSLAKRVNPKIFAKTVPSNQKLKEDIKKAVSFKGFSLLDIEQECVSFGKLLRVSSSS
jgi:2-oxoglutarate ferredoxin oxidoreductase subunit beta